MRFQPLHKKENSPALFARGSINFTTQHTTSRSTQRQRPGNQSSGSGKEDADFGDLRDDGCNKVLHRKPPDLRQTHPATPSPELAALVKSARTSMGPSAAFMAWDQRQLLSISLLSGGKTNDKSAWTRGLESRVYQIDLRFVMGPGSHSRCDMLSIPLRKHFRPPLAYGMIC